MILVQKYTWKLNIYKSYLIYIGKVSKLLDVFNTTFTFFLKFRILNLPSTQLYMVHMF